MIIDYNETDNTIDTKKSIPVSSFVCQDTTSLFKMKTETTEFSPLFHY